MLEQHDNKGFPVFQQVDIESECGHRNLEIDEKH